MELFCQSHHAETAQRWLNRMGWESGHEKMISFGVALDVRGAAKGVWCYYVANLDEKSVTYHGVPMTWEGWIKPILFFMDSRRAELSALRKQPDGGADELFQSSYDTAVMMLYYQNGMYMTLPGKEGKLLKTWVFRYLSNGYEPFPFPLDDDIPDGDYSFTIDFERDTEIVRAYDLKKEMGQYNAEHNAAHNQELGRRQTEERFAQLKGDTWTAQEILDQGFSRKTLDKFVKYGLILRVKKGRYVRNSV